MAAPSAVGVDDGGNIHGGLQGLDGYGDGSGGGGAEEAWRHGGSLSSASSFSSSDWGDEADSSSDGGGIASLPCAWGALQADADGRGGGDGGRGGGREGGMEAAVNGQAQAGVQGHAGGQAAECDITDEEEEAAGARTRAIGGCSSGTLPPARLAHELAQPPQTALQAAATAAGVPLRMSASGPDPPTSPHTEDGSASPPPPPPPHHQHHSHRSHELHKSSVSPQLRPKPGAVVAGRPRVILHVVGDADATGLGSGCAAGRGVLPVAACPARFPEAIFRHLNSIHTLPAPRTTPRAPLLCTSLCIIPAPPPPPPPPPAGRGLLLLPGGAPGRPAPGGAAAGGDAVQQRRLRGGQLRGARGGHTVRHHWALWDYEL